MTVITILRLENVIWRYDDDFKIEITDLQVEKGEIIAVVGPSGGGKTTLLKIILGDIGIQKGTIFLNNVDITNYKIERRNIGYCPQDQALFPHLNAYENIAFGLKAKNIPKSQIEEIVKKLAKIADINTLLHKKVHELSGGQKQRVAILRSLAVNPEIILLDEPFHNIDGPQKSQLALYLRNIVENIGITTIFVTHDINEAISLADRIAIISDGKVLQIDSPVNLINHPISFKSAKSMNLVNIFDKTQGSLFTDKTISSFIHIEPEKIIFQEGKTAKGKIIKGTLMAINPNINSNYMTLVFKIKTERKYIMLKMNSIEDVESSFVGKEFNLMIPDQAIHLF